MKFLIPILSFLITFFSAGVGFAQSVALSGHLLNKQTGEIVGNASVFETARGIGTISNDEGFFRLILEPGKKVLKITDAGFQDYFETFELTADTMITVALAPVYEFSKKERLSGTSGINQSGYEVEREIQD